MWIQVNLAASHTLVQHKPALARRGLNFFSFYAWMDFPDWFDETWRGYTSWVLKHFIWKLTKALPISPRSFWFHSSNVTHT